MSWKYWTGKKQGLIPGLEPETIEGLLIFDEIPSPTDQENINQWIISLKNAASLALGVNNLSTKYDFAFLYAVNNYENSKVDWTKGSKIGDSPAGPPTHIAYEGFTPSVSDSMLTDYRFQAIGNVTDEGNFCWMVANSNLDTRSTTRNAGGTHIDFQIVLYQNASGTPRFRGRSFSSALHNVLVNDNRSGVYFSFRDNLTQAKFQKNKLAPVTFSRTITSLNTTHQIIIGGYNNGFDGAQAPDTSAVFSSSILGTGDIDRDIISDGIRDYLFEYGIDIYDVT